MSIQEHLNKIRNAVYGHEVRESIAKGIETAYDDASEKDNANMEVKIARGTHPSLRSRLEEVDDKQQQTTAQLAHFASISLWDNDIIMALQKSDYVYIPKNTTITITSPLNKNHLEGKKIRGEGELSQFKVIGNTSAFDLSECTNVDITGVSIVVEPSNTSSIIKLGNIGNTQNTTGVKMSDITIVAGSLSDELQGNYTGLKLYSEGKGVWKNNFKNFRISRPNHGVLLHANCIEEGNLAWLTYNAFSHFSIYSSRITGFETRQTEINNGGTQLSHNYFEYITVNDGYHAPGIRRGIVVGGNNDTYIAPITFSDGRQGTFYGLSFNANPNNHWTGKLNHITGGTIEGLIENEEYRDFNVVDVALIKQSNFSTPARYDQFENYRNNIINALPNGNFARGKDYWNVVGTPGVFDVVEDVSSPFGRCLRATDPAGAGLQVYQELGHNKSLYAGKNVTFIALVKIEGATTDKQVEVSIDEGSSGLSKRSRPISGDYQLIYVNRHINGDGEAIQPKIKTPGVPNLRINIAWAMFVVSGYCITKNYVDNFASSVGVTGNSGTAVVPSEQTQVTITHNVKGSSANMITVTPTNSMGNSSKYWVEVTSPTTFKINVDTGPGKLTAKFNWNVNI